MKEIWDTQYMEVVTGSDMILPYHVINNVFNIEAKALCTSLTNCSPFR